MTKNELEVGENIPLENISKEYSPINKCGRQNIAGITVQWNVD